MENSEEKTPLGIKRKTKFFLASLFIFVFIIEAVSLGLNGIQGNLKFNYSEYYKKKEKLLWGSEEDYKIFGEAFDTEKRTHPYFGFRYTKEEWSDIHGFRNKNKLPFVKTDKMYVVGIFGGSVAMSFGNYVNYHNGGEVRRDFKSFVKKLKNLKEDTEVTILNLSVGGLKQPQQFFISSYFLDSLDMTINLDGFNELTDVPYPRYPVAFPSGSEHYIKDGEGKVFLEKIKSLRSSGVFIDALFLWIPLKDYSQSVFFIWSNITKIIGANIRGVFNSLKGLTGSINSEHPYIKRDDKTLLDLKVENWKKFLLKQYHLGSAYGKDMYFFIQPHFLHKFKKVLSPEEKQILIDVGSNQPDVLKGLNRLGEVARELNAEGIKVFELKKIFTNEPGRVFSDPCCHFNDNGNRVILENIKKLMTVK